MHTSRNSFSRLPYWLAAGCCLTLLVSGCSTGTKQSGRYSQSVDSAPEQPIDVSQVADAVPRVEPHSRYGNPESYKVFGKRYYTMKSSQGYVKRGIASWYGTKFHGHRTSSGETYDMYRMSAAHKTLPLPTYARVTNLENGKSVIVKINDRGPFHDNRLIDLSYAAASRLDILHQGTGFVEVRTINPQKSLSADATTKVAEKALEPVKVTMQNKPELYLQLGAFAQRNNAERLHNQVSAIELQGTPHIQETRLNQAQLYRVRIGPLDSVESADRISRILQNAGIDSPRIVID
jgi:rare lipoprotein A